MKDAFLEDIGKINCYSSSLLYVLKYHRSNLVFALKNLNVETSFFYDKFNEVFTSKKLVKNMAELGFVVKMEFCPNMKDKSIFQTLPKNSWFIVGMSCYHIPWSFFYQKKHITHYFPVFKKGNNQFFAFDPMYGKKNILIDISMIEQHAFEVKHITKQKWQLSQEKMDVTQKIKCLNDLQNKIIQKLKNYQALSQKQKNKLTEFVRTVLSNKYLTNNFFLMQKNQKNIGFSYRQSVVEPYINLYFGLQKLYLNSQDKELIKTLISLTKQTTKKEKEFLIFIEENM